MMVTAFFMRKRPLGNGEGEESAEHARIREHTPKPKPGDLPSVCHQGTFAQKVRCCEKNGGLKNRSVLTPLV